MGDLALKLAVFTDEVLFGDVYARPGLSQRDRSLITVAALLSLDRPSQLKSHMARALDNGVTRDELSELITQLAFYAGWPCAINGVMALRSVIEERKSAGDEIQDSMTEPNHRQVVRILPRE